MGSKLLITGASLAMIAAVTLGSGAVAHAQAAPPAAAAPADAASGEPGVWREHQIEFPYMGFTSIYSCDGLESKLKLLLRQLGARSDATVMAYPCARGYGRPDRFATARLKFATLAPADEAAGAGAAAAPGSAPVPAAPEPATPPVAATPVVGSWHTVQLAPHRPFDLQNGDCELIEQFRDKLLPLFSTRDAQVRTNCIPHQESGGPFSVELQVFAPLTRTASK